MTIWDRALDSTSPETSSEAAHRDVIEIIAQSRGLPRLDERLGGAAPECRNRLCPIPSHGLPAAAGPVSNATDDLQHFPHARLRLGGARPACLVERFTFEPDGLGELYLGHAERV